MCEVYKARKFGVVLAGSDELVSSVSLKDGKSGGLKPDPTQIFPDLGVGFWLTFNSAQAAQIVTLSFW